jgi:hypothetical protein
MVRDTKYYSEGLQIVLAATGLSPSYQNTLCGYLFGKLNIVGIPVVLLASVILE